MAGTHIAVAVDDAQARAMLERMAQVDKPGMLANIGERMVESTEKRFADERGPDGEKWQALNPAYRRRKKYNADKILTLEGYLSGRKPGQGPHWQPDGENAVAWGVSAKYGAVHQFGGVFSRTSTVRYHSVAGRTLFAKKSQSTGVTSKVVNFQVKIPARPFLGISAEDDKEIRSIILDWVVERSNR